MSTPSTPAPETSNVVLFEMVMWYRSQLENATSEIRTVRDQLAAQQQQIHTLTQDNRQLTTANRRGANLITMKHEAGRIFGECTDRMATLCGTMRREVPGIEPYCPDIERILLRADFAHHMMHGVNFVDLTTDEEMTEEEEEEDTE